MELKAQLSTLVSELVQHLREKKYSEDHIKSYTRTWEDLSRFMHRHGITHYCRQAGEDYLKERLRDTPYKDLKKYEKEIDRHIHVLSDYQEQNSFLKHRPRSSPVTFSETLGIPFNDFIEYSRSIKRNENTINNYKRYLKLLYADLHKSGKSTPGITVPYLVQFLIGVEKQHSDGVRNLIIATLRVFFQFLCTQKLLPDNRKEYWMSILRSRKIRQPKIPSVYSLDEIEKTIGTIDRGNGTGKRNYALILLAARYGLRISDIVGLRFCNIDWINNRILLVQGKTQQYIELPLSEEVGHAIIDYLRFGRPDVNSPFIFLSANAPYGRASREGLRRIILESMERAGVSIHGRKCGPHVFRHSLASNLLGVNEPLPVISEILGHSNTQSTKCYLRIDFNQLRQCALEVPCVPSSFYENLYE